jgi:hypothetical protein
MVFDMTRHFCLFTAFKPVVAPSQPPAYWVLGALPRFVKLIILNHPVPKLRLFGDIPSLTIRLYMQ